MFKDIYLQLITQMNNQDVSNISQNMQNEFDLDKIFSKYFDYFANRPLKISSARNTYYYTLDKIQLEVDIQINDENLLYYIKLIGPIEIEFDWSPYQPQTWDYPGNPGGISNITAVEWPFTKNLNDKNNDKVFELSIDAGTKDTTCKFSELPINVRYTVFDKLKEYVCTKQFFEEFCSIVQQHEQYVHF